MTRKAASASRGGSGSGRGSGRRRCGRKGSAKANANEAEEQAAGTDETRDRAKMKRQQQPTATIARFFSKENGEGAGGNNPAPVHPRELRRCSDTAPPDAPARIPVVSKGFFRGPG